MKVKIIGCKDSLMWYNKRIGEILEIVRDDGEVYWAREGGTWNCLNWIHKEDCEVLNE